MVAVFGGEGGAVGEGAAVEDALVGVPVVAAALLAVVFFEEEPQPTSVHVDTADAIPTTSHDSGG
jgi:hypothetical protein